MRLAMIYGVLLVAALANGGTAKADAAPADVADPFAYCARIGNIDTPAGGATPVPASLESGLRAALRLSAGSPFAASTYYWRCMQGAVYVCATGANIPCEAKANRAQHNVGADHFCLSHPDAAAVPAFATGHTTLYRWSCAAGHAVRGKVIAPLDRRGYRSDLWQRVDAGSSVK